MSSSIWFSEEITATIWNSSFKTILEKLEEFATESEVAAQILKENPVAAQIGAINLKGLSNQELRQFVDFVTLLQDDVASITTKWTTANNIAQFPIDLETTIEKAIKAQHLTP